MFDTNNSGYILDADLLQKLTQDKLADTVAAVTAEGWQWVEFRGSFDWQERSQFHQHQGELTPLSADQQEIYDFLTAELDELEASMNDEEADEDETTRDRIREIAESIDRMDDRPALYPPELMAESGAILSLDYDGALVIERGLMAKADAPRPEAAGQGKPAADLSGLSASLAEYLTARRTAAIRAELAQSPSVALAAVVHALALRVFYQGGSTCVEIVPRLNSLKSSIKNADDSKALAMLDAERDRWQDRLPEERADLWCLAQKQDTLLDLMAICAACTVDAVQRKRRAGRQHPPPCGRSGRGPEAGHGAVVYAHRVQLLRQNQQAGHARLDCRGERNALRPRMGKAEKGGTVLAERQTAGTGWLPKPVRLRPEAEVGTVVSLSKAA